MNEEIRTELHERVKTQRAIQEYATSLDESLDYKELYEIACTMAEQNIETALLLMIHIIKQDPIPMDEAIRDSIFLWVYSEGNRNTYTYLIKQTQKQYNEDVITYINDMAESIALKYERIGVKLRL